MRRKMLYQTEIIEDFGYMELIVIRKRYKVC